MPGFISNFMHYSMSVCESPIHFHLWSAMWTLGVAAGRRIRYMLHGVHEIYPNLFVVLVGPSATVQKSSTAKLGVSMLRECGVDIHTDRLTEAYIRDHMRELARKHNKAEMTAFASEMRVAINEIALKDGILQTMTDLWDCPNAKDFTTTRMHGRVTIPNVWYSFMGCSTPEWLIMGLKTDELQGGFAGRTVAVFGDTPHCRMALNATPSHDALQARLDAVAHIKRIRAMSGNFTIDPDAAAQWYTYHKAKDANVRDIDIRIKAFYNRSHIHLLKFAMLNSLSERLDMRITLDDINESIILIEDTLPMIQQSLRGVARTRHSELADMIHEIIRRAPNGQTTLKQLHTALARRRHRLTTTELHEVIQTLVDSGELKCDVTVNELGRRGTTTLRIATQEVLDELNATIQEAHTTNAKTH